MNYCSDYKLPDKYAGKIYTIGKQGIKTLFKNNKWPSTILYYLLSLQSQNIISDIILQHNEVIDNDTNRFNILTELYEFANDTAINDIFIDKKILSGLNNIIEFQNSGHRITTDQRYFIRKHFEIEQPGINIVSKFYNYIQAKGLLTDDSLMLLNPYTSILNLNEIYVQVKHKYTVFYKYKGHKYGNISLYTTKEIKQTEKNTRKYLEQLVAYVCMFPYLLGQNILETPPETISLYLVNFPKKFVIARGKDPHVYTSSEINTGVCDMINIAVTRLEESLKTVLHELFHYYKMDFRLPTKYNKHEQILETKYNINISPGLDGLNLFEAYTECIVSIINIICWTHFNNSSIINNNTNAISLTPNNVLLAESRRAKDSITTINNEIIYNMFTNQIIYSLHKLGKILLLSGCNSFMDPTCNLNQTTNVASYFLFKLFLYFNMDVLTKSCIMSDIPRFIDSSESYNIFMDIIKQGNQNKTITIILNHLLKNKNGNCSLKNNMSARMTCIDSN